MLRIHLKVILKTEFHSNLFLGQGSDPRKPAVLPNLGQV